MRTVGFSGLVLMLTRVDLVFRLCLLVACVCWVSLAIGILMISGGVP